MVTSFSKHSWLVLASATALTLANSTLSHAQDRAAPGGTRTGSDGPKITIPKPTAVVRALAMTSLADELKQIQDTVKSGQREKLVDVVADAEQDIKELETPSENDVTVSRLRTQRSILSSVVGNTDKVLNGVQTALITVASSSEVKKLAKGETSEPVVRTEKIPNALFDVQVTYEREGTGDESLLKRKVELVAKSTKELQQSKDPAIEAIVKDTGAASARDARFQPVLKEAVDAVVEQISEPVNGFLSESEVKTADIKDDKVPVETNLKDKKDALTAAMGEGEKAVADELSRTEEKRNLASEDANDEIERLRAKQKFADWAKNNVDEAKKLDECGMAEKAMEITDGALTFDMLDARTKEKCKKLEKKDVAANERKVFDPNSIDKIDANGVKQNGNQNLSQDQQRQQVIQQFLQTVQACMQSNVAATNSIDKLKSLIQPAYDAISGYEQLEKAISSSVVAQNILARMMTDGLDAESAGYDLMTELRGIFPDTNDGNTQLHGEKMKLFRLKGRLAYFVNEYNKRSEQMARAVGEMEAKKILELIARRDQGGDQSAAFELNLRAQQGQPTDPQTAYQVGYRGQLMERQRDPNHIQQMQYLEAVNSASLRVSGLYADREERHKGQSTAWVGSQSTNSMVNSARSAINNSPTLRSNPNIAVDTVLGGGTRLPASTAPGVSSGNLRSTGAPAPASQPAVRQPSNSNTNSRSSVFR